jgi:small neutral amino acid transporter SnatA (MarC family)
MSSFAATPVFSSPSAVTFALKPFIYPNKQSLNQVGSVVDIIILILTIFGACFILGGLALREVRTGTATVRQRLLAFLVLGDL